MRTTAAATSTSTATPTSTHTNINTGNIGSGNRATQNTAGGEKWSSDKQKGQVSRSVGANPPSSRVGDARRRRRSERLGGLDGRGRRRRLARRRRRRRAPARWTGRRRRAGSMDRGGVAAERRLDGPGGGGGGGAFDGYGSGRSTQMDSSRGASSRSASPSASSRASPSASSRGGGWRRRRRWRRRTPSLSPRHELHSPHHKVTTTMNPFASLKAGLRRALPALLLALPLALAAAEQRTFATPEAAVDALATALKANDERALIEIFGEKYRNLIVDRRSPADDAARRAEAAAWLATFRLLDDSSPDRRVLLVGDKAWPFPIPLVREGGVWRFATEQGAEEVLNRRVGRNERNALVRAAGLRRRAARVRIARPRRRRRAAVRSQARQQPGQVRRPVLAGRCEQERGGEPVRPADRAKRRLPRRTQQGRPVPRLPLPHPHAPGPGRGRRRLQLHDQRPPDRRLRDGGLARPVRRERRDDLHRQSQRQDLREGSRPKHRARPPRR